MSIWDILGDLLTPAKPQTHPLTPVTEITHDDLIAAVNLERSKHGLPSLRKFNTLENIAQYWTDQMVKNGRLSHGDFDGRIKHAIPNLTAAGEDIAEGQQTIASVMKSWMNSPPHRANILHTRFNQIGVGISKSPNGDIFWCLDFDRLRD